MKTKCCHSAEWFTKSGIVCTFNNNNGGLKPGWLLYVDKDLGFGYLVLPHSLKRQKKRRLKRLQSPFAENKSSVGERCFTGICGYRQELFGTPPIQQSSGLQVLYKCECKLLHLLVQPVAVQLHSFPLQSQTGKTLPLKLLTPWYLLILCCLLFIFDTYSDVKLLKEYVLAFQNDILHTLQSCRFILTTFANSFFPKTVFFALWEPSEG